MVTNENDATESLPAMNTEVTAQKKSARGRRAKVVEPTAAEDKEEATNGSEDPVLPAPVRGRRGKKTEAAAPPAVKQTRTRNAKSQENTSDDKPQALPEKLVEEQPATEVVSDESALKNTSQDENDSAAPVEEAVVKPTRGRKPKQPPAEAPQPKTEKNEVVSEEQPVVDPQSQESISTAGKPRRGRRTKVDTVEQNEAAEDSVVTEETKQPPVRAKRGRNAKQQEEEKQENDGVTAPAETSKSQEPVKKARRTRKAEQDVEPREETTEMAVAEVTEASPADEPLKMDEQVSVAAKPRRGRKAKQDTQSETPLEPTEVKEVPAVGATVKPKCGRRGKQVAEKVDVTAEVTEAKPDKDTEAEEMQTAEADVPVIKPTRGRGVKTVKNDVSHVIPAKRARRGAALPVEEANSEPTALVSESVPTAVEPPKRGRRAAAPKQSKDENPNEDAVEDTQASKRSVKWKSELEEVQVVEVTPAKAVRGRKSKVETENKKVSKGVSKPEEKDLSDEAVEAQPIKRARRGAKVTESSSEVDLKKSAEAETQPKARRGRPAKK